MVSKKKTRKNKLWVWATLLFLLIAFPFTLYAVYNIQTYGSIAAVRPSCVSHNDCPNNWMYCSGGECYSYTMADGVGAGCSNNNDCKNMMLNCVNGRCQRVVGEVGGCSISQDCVDQYRNTDQEGFWSCTNSQCIKLGGRPNGSDQYFDGTNWQEYGTRTACIHNSDCGPGATCSEYGCVWNTNRNQCHNDYECGLLPKDPNKKYVCVDASGQNIPRINDGVNTGTCELWDACDPKLEMVGGPTCGSGTHCEARTSGTAVGTPVGGNRRGTCVADAGTVPQAGQTPQGWTNPCPGGTIIERCSNTANGQRIRYCSNDPNFETNAIRWNGWQGPNGEGCIMGGEVWGTANQPRNIPLPSNVPASFYNTTGCALGTRIERCSNTYPGQRVSYCTEDEANPERSVVRSDNWVGSNGETCGLTGEIVANASADAVSWNNSEPTQTKISIFRIFSQPKPTNIPADVNVNGSVMDVGTGYVKSIPTSTPARANTNQNGNAQSIIDIVKMILDQYGSTDPAYKAADLNGDGTVDLQDMRELINTYRNQ